MENVNNVVERVPGLGKCPPNPRTNSTSLLSSSGEYYVASTIDFSGTDAALVRFVSVSLYSLPYPILMLW